MRSMSSKFHRAFGLVRLGLVAALVAACSNATSGIAGMGSDPGTSPGSDAPHLLRVKAGGQSGVEGSCVATPPGVTPPRRSFDPTAALKLFEGHHMTSLRWAPFWQPSSAASGQVEALTIAVTATGDAHDAGIEVGECGGQFIRKPVDVVMRTKDRSINVTFPSVVIALSSESAQLTTVFSDRSLLPAKLTLPGPAAHNHDADPLAIEIGFSSQGLAGRLMSQGQDQGDAPVSCRLAIVGDDCSDGARAMDIATAFGDFHVEDAVAALQMLGPQQLQWDDGTSTSIRFDFQLSDRPLCVHPYFPSQAADVSDGEVVEARLAAHLVTEDQRLDVQVPVRAAALTSETSGWNGHVQFSGSMMALASVINAQGGRADFKVPDQQLTRIQVSGTNFQNTGAIVQDGGSGTLGIASVTLDAQVPSPTDVIDTTDVDSRCFGSAAMVTSLRWRRAQ
jgi:hypothetical protein